MSIAYTQTKPPPARKLCFARQGKRHGLNLLIGHLFFALRFGFMTVSLSSLGGAGCSITSSICSAKVGPPSDVASVPSNGSFTLRPRLPGGRSASGSTNSPVVSFGFGIRSFMFSSSQLLCMESFPK